MARQPAKQLILMRHAKSSWKDSELGDFDRPLADRGERDAPRMGARLEARGARPALLLTSSAKRARRTAKLVARELDYPVERLQEAESLYLATPGAILDVVAAQSDGAACILLVGHNPGLTELVNELLPGLGLDNLPTGGVVAIDLDVARWSEVRGARGRLAYYDFPKNDGAAVTAS
jgi:phosphohistidine phosphatase